MGDIDRLIQPITAVLLGEQPRLATLGLMPSTVTAPGRPGLPSFALGVVNEDGEFTPILAIPMHQVETLRAELARIEHELRTGEVREVPAVSGPAAQG